MLSNRMAALAEDAGQHYRRAKAKTLEAAESYLACAAALAEARKECRRGEWGAVLARAGIVRRTAQLMIQVYRSGMDAERLAEVGVRGAALEVRRSTRGSPAALPDTNPEAEEAPESARDAHEPAPAAIGGGPPVTRASAADTAPASGMNGAARPVPPMDRKAKDRARIAGVREGRRKAGACLDCGRPSVLAICGRQTCDECRAARKRRPIRKALGAGLALRIEEAAAAGRGARLHPSDTASLAAVLARGMP